MSLNSVALYGSQNGPRAMVKAFPAGPLAYEAEVIAATLFYVYIYRDSII